MKMLVGISCLVWVLIEANAQVAWCRGAGASVGSHGGGNHGGGYHGGANHRPPSSGGGYFRGSGIHGSVFGNPGSAGYRVGASYNLPYGRSLTNPPFTGPGVPYNSPRAGSSTRYYRGSGAYSPGYLGWGYGGWGWGYPGWGFGFGYWPYFDYGTAWGLFGGYGGFQGTGNYGFGYPHESDDDGYMPAPSTVPAVPTPEDDFEVQATVPPENDYAGQAVLDFSAGRYREAVHKFRHAILDEPDNGRLMLLLSQALFAVGRYEEAAGTAEMGMRILPADKWGSVVTDHAKFYRSAAVYDTQLKDLEKARNGRPEAPALRVLLGYQYGYLGFPKHAVQELDKAIQLEPRDPYAVQLRNLFAKQIHLEPLPVPKATRPNQTPLEPARPLKPPPSE